MSINLGANETHFKTIALHPSVIENETERINDNTFGNITFERFYGYKIDKIGSNAFNNTANRLKKFICSNCSLLITNDTPKYDIKKAINQMINLTILDISLNETEIPAKSFQPVNSHLNISYLYLKSNQNLTIKSDALQFDKISAFKIYDSTIDQIEKSAFKFQSKKVYFGFENCQLRGESFQNGSFDGLQLPNFDIFFRRTNINYLAEGVFKDVLTNQYNQILFQYSGIDCSDCRNYWLIKNKKAQQIDAHCYGQLRKVLFDQEIQSKLKQKCI